MKSKLNFKSLLIVSVFVAGLLGFFAFTTVVEDDAKEIASYGEELYPTMNSETNSSIDLSKCGDSKKKEAKSEKGKCGDAKKECKDKKKKECKSKKRKECKDKKKKECESKKKKECNQKKCGDGKKVEKEVKEVKKVVEEVKSDSDQ